VTAERVEPAERREVPEEAPSKEKTLSVASSASRCPFCHVAVDLEAQEWVACESCLARHHATCWRDHGSCSSCAGTKSIGRVRSSRGSDLSYFLWAALVIALGTLVVLAVLSIERRIDLLQAQIAKSAPAVPQLDEQAYTEASIEERRLVNGINTWGAWRFIQDSLDYGTKTLLDLAKSYDRAHAVEDARRLRAAAEDAAADHPVAAVARLKGVSLEVVHRLAFMQVHDTLDGLTNASANWTDTLEGDAHWLEALERPEDARLCRDLARAATKKEKRFDEVKTALAPLVEKLSKETK
jgi:hypothetical protein